VGNIDRGSTFAQKTEPFFLAISADSHITEPPRTYIDRIDPKFRDMAPYVANDPRPGRSGEVFILPDMSPIAMGLVAAAGQDPATMKEDGGFADLHKGGWDPLARLVDQDRDGIAAEMIYPTVGMVLAGHPNRDYVQACSLAYNDWLQEYCDAAPTRLYGLGMTAVRSVEEAIQDFARMKEQGFKGVTMPGGPATEFDYDDPRFDPLWRAAVELDMPISFHVFTGGGSGPIKRDAEGKPLPNNLVPTRGPKITAWNQAIRGCQDIISLFIFGRVFERHPQLKLVCVEGDAGWAPHFAYRMDHVYDRHRKWMGFPAMNKRPGDTFRDNIYLTFQDDWVAFKMTNLCNPRRLMWANDFPHSDATWPWSQEMLEEHTKSLTDQERQWILHDNVKELYNLNVA